MPYELTHDTIGKLVFRKSSTEAHTRRKIEKYIRERHEAHTQRGVKLTQDDVDYIAPYLDQVNISSAEEAFIARGKRALVMARRWRGLLALAIIGILAVTVVSMYGLYEGARVAKRKAVKNEEIALENEKKAEAAEKIAISKQEETEIAKALSDSLTASLVQFRRNSSLKIFAALDVFKQMEDRSPLLKLVKKYEPEIRSIKRYAEEISTLVPVQDEQTKKWGYRGQDGLLIIGYQYEQAGPFNGGSAEVVLNGIDYTINIAGDTNRIIRELWTWEKGDLKEAFRGGTEAGKPLYIGRASFGQDHLKGLHPGKVRDRQFFFGWGGRAITTSPYEVLKIASGAEHKWIRSQEWEETYRRCGWKRVLGGSNSAFKDEPLYVCRSRVEQGNLIPGKLLDLPRQGQTCHYAYNGEEKLNRTDYELLVVAPQSLNCP